MDFGTMRAKVHEDMYTSLQQFKRDVLLLCFNAMNAYPETSRHHKVAEDIGCHAVNVFEDLNVQHEILNLDSSSNKEHQSKKSHGRQKSASPKFMGT
ncbi:bromodomain-containing protein 9-like [Trifolium pratense]|uniref:bromodomain-containing protein 9-like n=1 Tax=Trifolium pratense TaxID=57577 RepID=UPI001E69064F|nr:bromodomain-containing protein 9-like [Trifolium pratense]